jgi:2-polyprenyl-3-methyl-5-hydroxy-6-metoxy-1,4-benzoquinol methylase
MMTHDRRAAEQEFHDRQAALRAETFRVRAESLHFDSESFLDHETWVRPAFALLGDIHGKSVLDYGCGHGMAAITMARAGAKVTAFDLSPGYVNEARERAFANGVQVNCVTADGEELPFADASFHAVWGNAILHHLDLAKAGRELHRVLKPGGVAVFCEPWGGNPLLNFARRSLPYPGKDRTADEQPLTHRDLVPLRAVFPSLTLRGFQLFGMIRRVCPRSRALRWLDALDTRLLHAVPAFHNWCRYAVILLRKAD